MRRSGQQTRPRARALVGRLAAVRGSQHASTWHARARGQSAGAWRRPGDAALRPDDALLHRNLMRHLAALLRRFGSRKNSAHAPHLARREQSNVAGAATSRRSADFAATL
eukprot:6210099-Pleurochrysis_carterae.AAC.3